MLTVTRRPRARILVLLAAIAAAASSVGLPARAAGSSVGLPARAAGGTAAPTSTTPPVIIASTTAADFPAYTAAGVPSAPEPQILGRVTTAQGAGIGGLSVGLVYTDAATPAAIPDGSYPGVTAADGSFALAPLEASGDPTHFLSRTYQVVHAAGDAGFPAAASAPIHVGELGGFLDLEDSGPYITPRNPYWAIDGQVSGPAGSVVLGQVQTPTGWQTVSRTTSAPVTGPFAAESAGIFRFSLSFPGLHGGSQTVRAVRPTDAFQDEVDSTAATVTYTWDHLAGSSKSYVLEYPVRGQNPVHYSHCGPVTWAFNLGGAPPGALRLVREAFAEAGHYAGYHFKYLGTTKLRPSKAGSEKRARTGGDPDILVKWVPASGETDITRGFTGEAGLGGSTVAGTPGGPRLGGGDVLLIQDPVTGPLAMDFGTQGWGQVVLHELGHALGLNHTRDKGQVMYPSAGKVDRYGAGDVAGLRRIGRSGGCGTA